MAPLPAPWLAASPASPAAASSPTAPRLPRWYLFNNSCLINKGQVPLAGGDILDDGGCLGGGGGGAGSRAASRGGKSAAAANGRRVHGDYGTALGDKYDTRVTLPSGKKPDAVNWEAREVRELKPDNPAAIRRGEIQVERYRKELEEMTGKPWTSAVDTYQKAR